MVEHPQSIQESLVCQLHNLPDCEQVYYILFLYESIVIEQNHFLVLLSHLSKVLLKIVCSLVE